MGKPRRSGFKPGDVPANRPLPLHVFLVLPPSDETSKDLQTLVSEWARSKGRKLSTARTTLVRSKEGHQLNLLKPADVRALYRLCHEEYVVVLALVAARVQLDVSERPSKPGSLPLEEFVRYKALYARPADEEAMKRVLDEVSIDDSGCEDFRDPRCLPFAVFRPRKVLDLTEPKSRKEFKKSHKARRSTTAFADAGDREWSVGEYHTMELLHVAGCVLPYGFHWDVETRKSWTILNGWERWTLPGTKHVNVHPNGHIRGTSAMRTHAPADAEHGITQRTPAHERSRKK